MTRTELANVALGHLGESRVLDILEESPQAEHCRRMWNLVRDSLLRARPWNFALTLSTLARLADSPDFGWSYAYQFPENYMLAVEFNGLRAGTGEATFDIFGTQLHTDDETGELLYVRREETTSLWDPCFCEAFSLKLAAAICPSIAAAPGVADTLLARAEQAMVKALGPDSIETRPRAVLAQTGSGYMKARLGIATFPYP